MRRFFRKLGFCLKIMRSSKSGWIVIQLNAQQQIDVIENVNDTIFGASYIAVDPRVVNRLIGRLNQKPKDVQQPSVN